MQKAEEQEVLEDVEESAERDGEAEEVTCTSLEEPFAGNVSQCTPLPADGEAAAGKKGLLKFDACFEGGEKVRCHGQQHMYVN